jgi:antitoxin (DNA-binding transcriptional repressor) of toxin-antitoxin stability system
MEKTVTATEAARDLSELLNKIKFTGDSYVIKRGGKPVASIGPVREIEVVRSLKELRGILDALPKIGDDLQDFEKDLIEIWETQLSLPEEVDGNNP